MHARRFFAIGSLSGSENWSGRYIRSSGGAVVDPAVV